MKPFAPSPLCSLLKVCMCPSNHNTTALQCRAVSYLDRSNLHPFKPSALDMPTHPLAGASGPSSGGSVPELACEGGALEAETDERGRAFFGDMMVKAGTGHVVRGPGGIISLGWQGLCIMLS